MRRLTVNRWVLSGLLICGTFFIGSCASKLNDTFEYTPFYDSIDAEAPVVNSFDGVGCPGGAASFLDGGHNYCVPARESDKERYRAQGIVLPGDPGYEDCLPYDHVFFGGNCLNSLVPGTMAYYYLLHDIKPGSPSSH